MDNGKLTNIIHIHCGAIKPAFPIQRPPDKLVDGKSVINTAKLQSKAYIYQYIETNYDKKLSINEIATEVCLATAAFCVFSKRIHN